MTDRLLFSPAVQEPERLLSAREVASTLRISVSTFYTLSFFKTRKVRVSERRIAYRASDVATYQHIRAA